GVVAREGERRPRGAALCRVRGARGDVDRRHRVNGREPAGPCCREEYAASERLAEGIQGALLLQRDAIEQAHEPPAGTVPRGHVAGAVAVEVAERWPGPAVRFQIEC